MHYIVIGELAHLVERSLCMREGPGSTPGFSNYCNTSFSCSSVCQTPITFVNLVERLILGSIVVSIPACHAGDRGSIPRRGGMQLFLAHSLEIDNMFNI